MSVEEARPVLIGDTQGIAKAARDEKHRALALALEERIGRDRRPHLHRLDLAAGNRCIRRETEELADAGERGIAIALGVL